MEKKAKVLFLIHTLQIGGAEKVLVDLVNNMDKEKFDVTVMTVIDTGAFKYKLDDNVKYKTIFKNYLNRKLSEKSKNINEKSGNLLNKGSKLKNMFARFYAFFWRHSNCKAIYKRYIKEKYDIEIAFLEGISSKIIASSTNKESKKIAWIHVDLLKEKKSEQFFKNNKIEKETYEKFDKIITVSNIVKQSFINKYQYKEEKNVLVKYNPIDEKTILSKASEKLENLEETKNIKLCTIGRLSKQKGYDRLLKVIKRLNENKIIVDLWIIGEGPEENNLKKYIIKNNLKNVKLLGYKENPYPYIKKSDIFVSSSRAEGFSTVISEAVILGKVIVATDCAGTKEILGKDNEFGIVTENSEDGLYEGLNKILSDRKLFDYYSDKIKYRNEIFNFKKSIEEIEDVLGE